MTYMMYKNYIMYARSNMKSDGLNLDSLSDKKKNKKNKKKKKRRKQEHW